MKVELRPLNIRTRRPLIASEWEIQYSGEDKSQISGV
jgi:hypothetical protein